jgi:hypothetical protein
VNSLLKERWVDLADEEKAHWRAWAEWDKKRHAHELVIFQNRRSEDLETEAYADYEEDVTQNFHVPKKRKSTAVSSSIPKKKRS